MTLRLLSSLLFCCLNPHVPQPSLWERKKKERNVRQEILMIEMETWGPRGILPHKDPQEQQTPGGQVRGQVRGPLSDRALGGLGEHAGCLLGSWRSRGRKEGKPKLETSLHSRPRPRPSPAPG